MEFGPAPRTLPSAPTTRCAGTNRSIGVCRIRRASIAGSHAPEIRGRDTVAVSRHHQAGAQRRGDRQTCYLHRGYKRRMNEQTRIPPEERAEIRDLAKEAREGDKTLDSYDKEVADSFPGSDPPATP